VQTVYELPLPPGNSAAEHFYTNLERCEVLTGYLSCGRRPGGYWANTWHWTKVFFCKLGEYVTLDGMFYSHLLESGRIRDIGRNVLQFLLVTGRICDNGQNFYSLLLETGRISDTGQNVLE